MLVIIHSFIDHSRIITRYYSDYPLTGKVYSLGRKEYGRLGMEAIENDLSVPTPTLSSEKCIEVAAGEVVSLAVTESGTHRINLTSNGT